jgi:hypothetical protein
MKTSTIFAVAATVMLQSQQVQAFPAAGLIARGKADILLTLLEFFGGFFPKAERTW